MPLPRYQPGQHVRARREVDGTLVLAAAFVITTEPDHIVVVEYLADGSRARFPAAADPDTLLPD